MAAEMDGWSLIGEYAYDDEEGDEDEEGALVDLWVEPRSSHAIPYEQLDAHQQMARVKMFTGDGYHNRLARRLLMEFAPAEYERCREAAEAWDEECDDE